MKRIAFAPLLMLALAFAFAASAQLPFSSTSTGYTFEDLMKIRRVSDPQLSPDGATVAFSASEVVLTANRTITHIFTVPVAGGGEVRQLTRGDRSNSTPRWSPDGKKIAFTTGGQIWTMNPDGGEKKTDHPHFDRRERSGLVARRALDSVRV